MIFATLATSSLADTYSILRGDRIYLRAGWWDHAAVQYRDWVGVSGEYVVDPEGKISVPLAGIVDASGETIEALSATLSQQIQRRVGLTGQPEVAIEIVGHTPIYVLGSVAAPGEYIFRRGMTVQQAISLAGGIGGNEVGQADSAERDAIRYGGNMRVLAKQIAALSAERARLTDEIAALESQAAGTDEALSTTSEGIEREIFEARQRSADIRSRNIRELQTVISEQITRIEEQISLRETQLDIAQADAEAMETLKDRGLAVRARESAVLTTVANMEAQLIQLKVARLEAVQQLNLARRDEITLYDEARLGRLARLKQVELDLSTKRTEEETARRLYTDAIARSSVSTEELSEIVTRYFVSRNLQSGPDRISASAATPLEPGDTLEIVLEFLEPRLEN